MRYDLEIPSLSNSKLVYVPSGEIIGDKLSTLAYYSISTKDAFINEFITIESAFAKREFLADGYETKTGQSFSVSSNKVILTHISKFSIKEGVNIPLFYKHIIDDEVPADTIKIVDYFNTEIDKDEYLIESVGGKTYIYMNAIEKILFIQYISESNFNKSLLSLEPVFSEPTWESLASNGTITGFEYFYNNGDIITKYNGTIYLSYINNIRMIREPIGDIDDAWYASILNCDFTITKDGIDYRYATPEFYRQRFDSDGYIKKVVNKKCRKIFPDIVKSQYNISKRMPTSIYLYVKDYFTGVVKYAFTSDSSIIGTEYSNSIYYSELLDSSPSGLIILPIQLEEDDIAVVTHFTDEEYCEYTGYNMNSLASQEESYCAIYLKPFISQDVSSISHVIIGDGGDYDTYESYTSWIDSNNYLHIALVGLAAYGENKQGLKIYDARQGGSKVKDKLLACKTTVDALYKEIMDKDLMIATNDTVMAVLDPTRFISENKIELNSNGDGVTDKSLKVLDLIKRTMDSNLDVSTKSILKIRLG